MVLVMICNVARRSMVVLRKEKIFWKTVKKEIEKYLDEAEEYKEGGD